MGIQFVVPFLREWTLPLNHSNLFYLHYFREGVSPCSLSVFRDSSLKTRICHLLTHNDCFPFITLYVPWTHMTQTGLSSVITGSFQNSLEIYSFFLDVGLDSWIQSSHHCEGIYLRITPNREKQRDGWTDA